MKDGYIKEVSLVVLSDVDEYCYATENIGVSEKSITVKTLTNNVTEKTFYTYFGDIAGSEDIVRGEYSIESKNFLGLIYEDADDDLVGDADALGQFYLVVKDSTINEVDYVVGDYYGCMKVREKYKWKKCGLGSYLQLIEVEI